MRRGEAAKHQCRVPMEAELVHIRRVQSIHVRHGHPRVRSASVWPSAFTATRFELKNVNTCLSHATSRYAWPPDRCRQQETTPSTSLSLP